MSAAGEMTRSARRTLAWPLAAWAVLAGAGYLPARSLRGRSGIEAMLAGQAVVVFIVYATLVPAMRRMAGADAAGRLRAVLKAGAMRLILTLPVIAVIVWLGSVDPVAFLVWVAIAYVVTTKIETLALVSWNRRLENRR